MKTILLTSLLVFSTASFSTPYKTNVSIDSNDIETFTFSSTIDKSGVFQDTLTIPCIDLLAYNYSVGVTYNLTNNSYNPNVSINLHRPGSIESLSSSGQVYNYDQVNRWLSNQDNFVIDVSGISDVTNPVTYNLTGTFTQVAITAFEPETWLLMTLGIGLVGLKRKRYEKVSYLNLRM